MCADWLLLGAVEPALVNAHLHEISTTSDGLFENILDTEQQKQHKTKEVVGDSLHISTVGGTDSFAYVTIRTLNKGNSRY